MIKTVMLCGEEFEENGKYYFKKHTSFISYNNV